MLGNLSSRTGNSMAAESRGSNICEAPENQGREGSVGACVYMCASEHGHPQASSPLCPRPHMWTLDPLTPNTIPRPQDLATTRRQCAKSHIPTLPSKAIVGRGKAVCKAVDTESGGVPLLSMRRAAPQTPWTLWPALIQHCQ